MGGCLQKCFLSQPGTICCSIISIIGMLYFFLTWIIFESQYVFFQFHIPDKQGIQTSCLISAIIYLAFFIWTIYRLYSMNQLKVQNDNQKIKKSISQVNSNSIAQVYEQQSKFEQKQSERMLLRQQ